MKLNRFEIKFVAGASRIEHLPNFYMPQVAFVGKSNVGKSSLINFICGRKALARVSHTPGRTQQINFFDVGGKLILVDLPGYGYAKVSMKQKAGWEKLITHYLFNTPTLKLVNILIDSRRGIKEHDLDVIDMVISRGLSIQIICTKSDEIKEHDALKAEIMALFKERHNKDVKVIFTSVKDKEGAFEFQKSLFEAL